MNIKLLEKVRIGGVAINIDRGDLGTIQETDFPGPSNTDDDVYGPNVYPSSPGGYGWEAAWEFGGRLNPTDEDIHADSTHLRRLHINNLLT